VGEFTGVFVFLCVRRAKRKKKDGKDENGESASSVNTAG